MGRKIWLWIIAGLAILLALTVTVAMVLHSLKGDAPEPEVPGVSQEQTQESEQDTTEAAQPEETTLEQTQEATQAPTQEQTQAPTQDPTQAPSQDGPSVGPNETPWN